MGQKLEIVRGTTSPIYIELSDADGAPMVLTDENRLLLGVIPILGGERLLFKEAVADEENGGYVFLLKPEDTAEIPAGDYKYDINLEYGEAFLNVVKLSDFKVIDSTTKQGDGV